MWLLKNVGYNGDAVITLDPFKCAIVVDVYGKNEYGEETVDTTMAIYDHFNEFIVWADKNFTEQFKQDLNAITETLLDNLKTNWFK